MKGVPTSTVKWTAKRRYPKLNETEAVKQLYLDLMNGEQIRFDLTQNGTRTGFDSRRDFTVKTREKFDRDIRFLNPDVDEF